MMLPRIVGVVAGLVIVAINRLTCSKIYVIAIALGSRLTARPRAAAAA